MVHLYWGVKLKVSRADGRSWFSGSLMLGCEAQGFKNREVVLVEWFSYAGV